MKSVKRMVLLPEEKYHRLLNYQKEHLQRLQSDDEVSPHPSTGEQSGNGPNLTVIDEHPGEKVSIDLLIAGIPRVYRAKARALLDYIHQSSVVDWNSEGQVVVGGAPIPGTHIADLVRHAMRSYKNFNPKGLSEFYRGLRSMNVPLGLIGNPEALQALETGNIVARRPPGIPAVQKRQTALGWVNLGQ